MEEQSVRAAPPASAAARLETVAQVRAEPSVQRVERSAIPVEKAAAGRVHPRVAIPAQADLVLVEPAQEAGAQAAAGRAHPQAAMPAQAEPAPVGPWPGLVVVPGQVAPMAAWRARVDVQLAAKPAAAQTQAGAGRPVRAKHRQIIVQVTLSARSQQVQVIASAATAVAVEHA